jgi:hypothetical protein
MITGAPSFLGSCSLPFGARGVLGELRNPFRGSAVQRGPTGRPSLRGGWPRKPFFLGVSDG